LGCEYGYKPINNSTYIQAINNLNLTTGVQNMNLTNEAKQNITFRSKTWKLTEEPLQRVPLLNH